MTALENMNLQQQDSSRVSETSVDEVLIRLKLTEFKSSFVREKINLESFYLLTESDLIQMGLPIGPRRIVCEEIRNRALQREREEVGKKIKNKLADLRRAQKQELNQEVEKKSDDYFNYGLAGTGQLIIKYPQLYFKVKNFFALGSPIAVFLAVRGVEKLSPEFKLPNCEGFFNIFHPVIKIYFLFFYFILFLLKNILFKVWSGCVSIWAIDKYKNVIFSTSGSHGTSQRPKTFALG